MASLKAKLKRTLEPQDPLIYHHYPDLALGERTDTLLDFTEPINGWIMTNAIILIDFTVMAFMEGNLSGSGAIRCSHALVLEGPGDGYDGYISCQSSGTGTGMMYGGSNGYVDATQIWDPIADEHVNERLYIEGLSSCRYWPSCLTDTLMEFPYLAAVGTRRGILYPGSGRVLIDDPGDRPSKPQRLEIQYGAYHSGAPTYFPIRFYISADIMIFDSDEVG